MNIRLKPVIASLKTFDSSGFFSNIQSMFSPKTFSITVFPVLIA